jgi:hypothetical protein
MEKEEVIKLINDFLESLSKIDDLFFKKRKQELMEYVGKLVTIYNDKKKELQ